MNSKIENVELIEIPRVHDERGLLAVIEGTTIPFPIERVYYLYDVPSDAFRGGHAHKELYQLLIPLSGSFDVHLKDGETTKIINLNKPHKGLLIVPGIWREIDNFSSGCVCLVLASAQYNEDDYIRNFNDFLAFKNS
ncbi:sugar 3,4-ketoisomerase [Winogradskyella alexanderae]|uniref:FdtA/QdtA family cupin domain-containing protein n=1 Tax=Winogradskyella alexanderae TaxID=2877123 RepID=A0ABS7XSV0_9FLAO|nr:FdtA/QdtA family cupin domain-containing protein [Winogradskyella alexanderae]MCA0132855.1 FdtA/QdtA family cupin domain-containing protein [Winogradskyella alexanderae]